MSEESTLVQCDAAGERGHPCFGTDEIAVMSAPYLMLIDEAQICCLNQFLTKDIWINI